MSETHIKWRLSPAASWKIVGRRIIVACDDCLMFETEDSNLDETTRLFRQLCGDGLSMTAIKQCHEIHQIVNTLMKTDLLIAAEQCDCDATLERQAEWLAALGVPLTHAHERITSSCVAIIGIGGIGANVLLQFLMMGIREVILIDNDVVEMHNLNRQPIYSFKDCGTKKVQAASKFIKNRYPQILPTPIHSSIDSEEKLSSIHQLERANLIVACADNPMLNVEEAVLQYSVKSNIPVTFASCGFKKGYYGPLVAGTDAAKKLRDTKANLAAFERQFGIAPGMPPAIASVGPTNALVASLLALDCLLFLSGKLTRFSERTIEFTKC